jgi:hypothetical protein
MKGSALGDYRAVNPKQYGHFNLIDKGANAKAI